MSPRLAAADPVRDAVALKERRLEAQRKVIERRQGEALAQCTFRPVICQRSLELAAYGARSRPSLHEPRVFQCKSEEEGPELAASPLIDPKSRLLCERQNRDGPVHNRLLSYGDQVRHRISLLEQQAKDSQMPNCPVLLASPKSATFVKQRYGDSNFDERSKGYKQQQQEKREKLVLEAERRMRELVEHKSFVNVASLNILQRSRQRRAPEQTRPTSAPASQWRNGGSRCRSDSGDEAAGFRKSISPKSNRKGSPGDAKLGSKLASRSPGTRAERQRSRAEEADDDLLHEMDDDLFHEIDKARREFFRIVKEKEKRVMEELHDMHADEKGPRNCRFCENKADELIARCAFLESENRALRCKNEELESEKDKLKQTFDAILEKGKAVVGLNQSLARKVSLFLPRPVPRFLAWLMI